MNVEWCQQVYEDAIKQYGSPEIINTDQGSQFTSPIFTKVSLDREIKISMDGKGIYRERNQGLEGHARWCTQPPIQRA